MLEKTWRWFGEEDSISLSEIRQMGVEGIVTSLHHIPNGEVWPVDQILQIKNEIESHGMRWSVVESLPVSEGIKTANADRSRLIENYKASLLNLGRCGIDTVCYNFMPVLDWARTNTHYKLENGGESMSFDLPTFAAFDIFILKRPNAIVDYSSEVLAQAESVFSKLNPEEQEALAYNIIVLTQGFVNGTVGETSNYKAIFQMYLDTYQNIDAQQLKKNLSDFLNEIMPIADKYNVKMCIHPDDPPFPVLGLPRIMSTQQDLEWITQQYPSTNNGITLCAGSLSVLVENNLVNIVESIGSHIHFVHLRSTQRLESRSFYEADHLKGDVDMYELINALLKEQIKRKNEGRSDVRMPFRPDHGVKMLDDYKRKSNPGYPLIGRLKGLSEIVGMGTAIEKNLLKAVLVLCFVLVNIYSNGKNKINKPVIFKPTWESLSQYKFPEWFRDAKFGIWAHWGAQCEPEDGDWYGRNMYIEKTAGYRFSNDSISKIGIETSCQYRYHLDHYGHPSEFGFKDVIHEWKAENFDPDTLIALYKDCGAKYFMAMANHHDNFDNYNSKYQPWNSVAIGPKKDLIGMWAAAARKQGLRFGVSVHCSHAWSWYETARGSDTEGPYAGIPYDGKLTKADGKGKWWDGLDPQDLYAQNHKPNPYNRIEWSWNPALGCSIPDSAYMQKFYNRVVQLWDDYKPDQIYFDDFVMPFYEIDPKFGLKLAAHFYNTNTKLNGQNEAVMNTKMLNESQRKALVYDIEKSNATGILPEPWQTDECIGHWHYDRQVYYHQGYKQAGEIIPMLADIVSKNGNLMLNLPLRGDGTLDQDEVKIIKEIGAWLKVNGEAIFATRPWKIYGEGPASHKYKQVQTYGHTDVVYTSEDIRFTRSKDNTILYAIVLAWPEDGKISIKSLASNAPTAEKIKAVSLIGYEGKIDWRIDNSGLHINLPVQAKPKYGFAIKLSI